MVKPLTRTAVLDELPIDASPEVRINRHSLDWNTLAEGVVDRIDAVLRQDAIGCRYFNPVVTVSCSNPTSEFFGIVLKEQASWCRRASETIRRNARRRVSNWVSDESPVNKHARFLHRALCFTGILFIDGRICPNHCWPASISRR